MVVLPLGIRYAVTCFDGLPNARVERVLAFSKRTGRIHNIPIDLGSSSIPPAGDHGYDGWRVVDEHRSTDNFSLFGVLGRIPGRIGRYDTKQVPSIGQNIGI